MYLSIISTSLIIFLLYIINPIFIKLLISFYIKILYKLSPLLIIIIITFKVSIITCLIYILNTIKPINI